MGNNISKSFGVLLLLAVSISNLMAGNSKTYPAGFKPQENNTISFTENKGQVHDQNYKPRPDVLFGGTDGNLVFHLKNNGISYQLSRANSQDEKDAKLTPIIYESELEGIESKTTIYRLDINWINSNVNASITKGKAIEGFNNYYLETCPNGALNVKSYENITYQNIYNGIDLKWYQKNGTLKYDYLVAPGANYKQIQLEIKGAILKLQKNGSLLLKTPLGEIIEQAPVVFQNGKTLKSRYVLKNNVLSFEVENYDPTKELIIDPIIRVYGTYYGGTVVESGQSCSTDANNNVYLSGYTSSTGTILATTGAHQTTMAGGNDAFLVKFNAAGSRQWATYLGAAFDDRGYSCATDAAGNIYMTGYTNSNSAFATAGAHQTANGGTYDAFLVKFNSAGVRQWSTYYGGTGDERGWFCSTDASGNVYLTGQTTLTSGTVIATAGVHQPASGGSIDAFLVKFNSAGVRQWGTYYGDTGSEIGYGCANDASGNVYLSGETTTSTGTVLVTAAAHQTVYGGSTSDAFLVKFNATNGARIWGTLYGGSSADYGYSCATDASGNVYLAGQTASSGVTVIATAGAHQTTNGGFDAYLVKFNSSGVRQWGTYYGSGNPEDARSCKTDGSGNVYIAGKTGSAASPTLIATTDGHQLTLSGTSDAFIAKFNTSGVRQWGTYYGGTGVENGFGCAVDAAGDFYLAGNTTISTGTTIANPSSFQSTSGGSDDAFLVKFTNCTLPASPANTSLPANQIVCALKATTLTASASGTINWFNSSTGGTSVASGTSFITPILSSGIYTIYAEALTCLPSATRTAITVTINPNPNVIVNSGAICLGKTFTMTPSGATSYTFSSGSATVSPTALTNYTVTGANSFGCTNTVVSSVTVNPNPTITVNSGVICSGNVFTLNPGGATSYTYSSGSNTVTPLANTSYTVTGSNSFGCTHSVVSSVTVNTTPTVSVNSGSVCSGKIFTLTPNGASTYTYSSGSNTVSPLINTSYTVIGASAQGCTNMAVSNITVSTTPTINVSGGSVCPGGSFTFNPSGASTYTYSNGQIVTPVATTNYTISGTSAQGCTATPVVATVIFTNNLIVSISSSNTVCSGQPIILTAGGASTYSWSTGGNTFTISPTPTITTTYSVLGSSGTCSNTAIKTITVNPNPSVAAVSNNSLICVGQSATLTANGANVYVWNPSGSGVTIVVSPTITSTYTVTGTDGNGCSNTAVITQSVDLCTNISGKTESYVGSISVYPNPSNGIFYLKMPAPSQILITNTIGQELLRQKFGLGLHKIDLSNFANGVYFIKAIFDDNMQSLKIIKE